MQRLFLIIIIAAILAAAYLFLDKKESLSTSAIPAPTQEPSSPNAKKHIDALTQGANDPIEIGKADNFVTSDQLLKLPKKSTETASAITEEALAANPETSGDEGAATFAVSSHINIIKTDTATTASGSDNANPLTSLSLENQIKLQELLDNPDQAASNIYFIHAVNENDDEGLWGIIQHGLMSTFTKGLVLPGLDKTVTVDIPKDADEKLDNKRSSFLGQILKNKVDRTYIYNYEKGILGDNPNLITPGQQLIIVTFTEEELITIYNHFTSL
ncbi:hypothetical protein [Neptuniibacter pectenicola]|jgi:hypothetical protein|uniref:hypothetical protein n=1 Tax=Neptuniibacter pectenicola TaxID=1806669 RepID=UPI0030EE6F87|tara:strand:+ start:15120 stop:15935 length:816 start_codon:yes stop_codon:yes gene_type:complete